MLNTEFGMSNAKVVVYLHIVIFHDIQFPFRIPKELRIKNFRIRHSEFRIQNLYLCLVAFIHTYV